jgi:hypothetical protein
MSAHLHHTGPRDERWRGAAHFARWFYVGGGCAWKGSHLVTPKGAALTLITLPEGLDSPPILTLGVAVEFVG